MRRTLILTKRIGTVALWLLCAFNVIPWGFHLDPDAYLFCIAAACVGSYAWIARAHGRPVDEVYLAGKAIGRREVELELECDRVVRLTERQPERRLTVVGD